MNDQELGALYERSGVWEQELTEGQRRLSQAIADFWPDNVRNVLDVGSGDGKVATRIAELTQAQITALDGSSAALEKNVLPKRQGDVADPGSYTGEFDCILSTDVLEHLDDATEHATLQNIFSSARKAVVLAVPYNEFLPDSIAKCGDCNHLYHLNWHKRTYSAPKLKSRLPPDWSIGGFVLSGEPWSAKPTPVTLWQRVTQTSFATWSEGRCPHCGSGNQIGGDAFAPVPHELVSAFISSRESAAFQDRSRTHTEIIMFAFRDAQDAEHWRQLTRKRLAPRRALVQASPLDSIALPATAEQLSTNALNLPVHPHAFQRADGVVSVQLPQSRRGSTFVICRKPEYSEQPIKISATANWALVASCDLSAGQLSTTIYIPRSKDDIYGVILSVSNFVPHLQIYSPNADRCGLFLTGKETERTYHRVPFSHADWWVQVYGRQFLGADDLGFMTDAPNILPVDLENWAETPLSAAEICRRTLLV